MYTHQVSGFGGTHFRKCKNPNYRADTIYTKYRGLGARTFKNATAQITEQTLFRLETSLSGVKILPGNVDFRIKKIDSVSYKSWFRYWRWYLSLQFQIFIDDVNICKIYPRIT